MKIRCRDCKGTGIRGFQRENCWRCGGSGYVDDLVHRTIKLDTTMIKPIKSVTDIKYNGDLDKYFKEVKECQITNDITAILRDIYDLIKSNK